MSGPLYVVLRMAGETLETIGPAGTKFHSFTDADAYAKALRDRFTSQSFAVCKAVTAYETRAAGLVTRFGGDQPEPRTRKSDARPPVVESEAASLAVDDEKILQMHPRKKTKR